MAREYATRAEAENAPCTPWEIFTAFLFTIAFFGACIGLGIGLAGGLG